MRFSARLPTDLTPSELSQTLDSEARASTCVDLTVSNPTRVGLHYDEPALRAALHDGPWLTYAPTPLGSLSARAAVAAYLQQQRGIEVAPARLALTASTSEAYSVLFKLLCDPGDAIAVPAPSYPLVPHLAELESVRALPYALSLGREGWRIDFKSLEQALAAGARAVVAINPNNPTGNGVGAAEAERLRTTCARAGAALIADEVFAPYGAAGTPMPSLGGDGGPLTFVLDGLSKCAALPQLKLGWIAMFGTALLLEQARSRLEWLLDAYLSVATPVQTAAPALLASAGAMQAQLRARLATHRQTLAAALLEAPGVELLPADGGWYAVLALPEDSDEESVVAALATRHRVLVHPGFFYDFEKGAHLVVSLIAEPASFAAGVRALASGIRSEVVAPAG